MPKKPYGAVYVFTCATNGKRYVGQTTARDPIRYCGVHLRSALSGKNRLFYNAIRKHGVDAFSFEIVGYADDKQALDLLEDYLILVLGSLVPGGYNLRRGGARGKLSLLARQHMSASQLITQNDPDVKAKIAAVMVTPEYKERFSEIQRVAQNRPEVKAAQNLGRARRLTQPGQREKLSLIQQEVQGRPEVRAKISLNTRLALARPEVKIKRAITLSNPEVKARRGAPHRGKRWVNNGVETTTIKAGVAIPDGWVLGRLMRRRERCQG